MLCRPGQLGSKAIFELNGILTHFSPKTNIAPPCDSKIAVGHIAISITFRLIIHPPRCRANQPQESMEVFERTVITEFSHHQCYLC